MHSDDGNLTVVFNGEIYNHAEIRLELEARGHRFFSNCDTEVALRAFLEWDVRAFSRFRGMFAIAYWMQAEKRLLLVRDRMGIKPLYYSVTKGDLYFGSELKSLFVHPEIERTLDLRALSDYLSLNYVPAPRTLIQGIQKVLPGHWLEWRKGRIDSHQYWQLEPRPDRSMTLNGAAEQLDELLRQSVKEQLVSDVPLGVWSSGGLDSSTLLHYASELSPRQLKTFSVSFNGISCDESHYFRRTAQHYGTDHHEFNMGPNDDIAAVVEDLAHYSDEPSADAGALPVWFLSKMTRREVTVALSGDGADELLAGYCTYRADAYAAHIRRLPQSLRGLFNQLSLFLPVSDQKIGFEYKLKRLLAGSLLSEDESHFFWNGTFNGKEKHALLSSNGHPCVGSLYHTLPVHGRHLSRLNRNLLVDQTYYLPDDILYKCDRMSMAHSLEVRPAFLDHRIVEFAATLPEALKLNGSTTKVVLRHLMRDKLPPQIIQRKKEGFDIPAHAWFRTILKPLLLDTINRQTVEASDLFHWPAVKAVIEDHMERRANLGYHLWGLLTLFLWMQKWSIRVPDKGQEIDQRLSTVAVTN